MMNSEQTVRFVVVVLVQWCGVHRNLKEKKKKRFGSFSIKKKKFKSFLFSKLLQWCGVHEDLKEKKHKALSLKTASFSIKTH
jgi:hypothetical protein